MKKIHFQKRDLKITNQKKKKTMKKIIMTIIMIMKLRKNLQKRKERKIM